MAAEFIISAAQPDQFPSEDLPEVAFLGRSNVGKSSLLNRLVGAGKVAHVSGRPGSTHAINFYLIDGSLRFADLPGYGYARVSRRETENWKRLAEAYLGERQNLVLCCLLLDARRGWMEKDLELKRWLELRQRRFLVIATKFDKLKTQSERHRGMAALRKNYPEGDIVPFSAVTGQGAREIWQAIQKLGIKP